MARGSGTGWAGGQTGPANYYRAGDTARNVAPESGAAAGATAAATTATAARAIMLRKQFGILDSCLWLRMRRQCLRPVNHPLREYWRILRRLATCNGPVIEPPGSFFSDVIIVQAVSLIA